MHQRIILVDTCLECPYCRWLGEQPYCGNRRNGWDNSAWRIIYDRHMIPEYCPLPFAKKEVEMTRVVHCLHEHYDIYIGRAMRRYGLGQSIWHNPYHIGRDGSREEVIEKYRQYLLSKSELMARLSELKGKILGCWCKPLNNCHGDVLAELADQS